MSPWLDYGYHCGYGKGYGYGTSLVWTHEPLLEYDGTTLRVVRRDCTTNKPQFNN